MNISYLKNDLLFSFFLIRRMNIETRLQEWRNTQAISKQVPPFYILQNKTLQLLIETPPTTLHELYSTKGIGLKKVQDYGQQLLKTCSNVEITKTNVDNFIAQHTTKKRRTKTTKVKSTNSPNQILKFLTPSKPDKSVVCKTTNTLVASLSVSQKEAFLSLTAS